MEYNNNIFSLNGKMSRSAYILYSLLISLIGFRFIYYPSIMTEIQSSPQFNELIDLLSKNPNNAWLVKELMTIPETTFIISLVKYMLLIPCRLIDIKRVRDIRGRVLTTFENIFISVVFSLPYIDFFSTLVLSVMKPRESLSYHDISKASHDLDRLEAKKENDFLNSKKLFEEGKISRAEFEEIKNNYSKSSLSK